MKRGALLIDKYIREGLTPEERYELEKLALDDPLLAEAWEGLSAPYATDNLGAIKRLDKRLLGQSTEQAKVVPLYKKIWPYAVAASLAMVMTFGILLRQDSASEGVSGFASDQIESTSRSYKSAPVAMATESTPETPDAAKETTIVSSSAPARTIVSDASTNTTKAEAVPADATKEVTYESVTVATSSEEQHDNMDHSRKKAISSKTSAARSAGTGEVSSFQPDMMAARKVAVDNDVVAIATRDGNDKNLKTPADGSVATHQEVDYNAEAISISPEELAGQMDMPVTYIPDTMKEETAKKTEEYKAKGKEPAVVPSDEIAEKMSMPSTPVNPIIEPMPAVGFTEYEKLLNDQVDIPKEDFFMKGIKEYMPVYVLFEVDKKGNPKEVKFSKEPSLTDDQKSQILKAFESVSPWTDAPTGRTLSYTLKLRHN